MQKPEDLEASPRQSYRAVARVVQILDILRACPEGLEAEQVCATLHISRRTLRRYIAAIHEGLEKASSESKLVVKRHNCVTSLYLVPRNERRASA
jgi:DNA-binding NarL/FixJ family response regulator